MQLFSSKQKVYTTDSVPINASEDVDVEGKRYPTNRFGRLIAQHPFFAFLTVLLPFAFFVIGCVSIRSDLSYKLADYNLRPSLPVRRDSIVYDDVMDSWTSALSGDSWLMGNVDKSKTRAIVQDYVEMRAVLSLSDLYEYLTQLGSSTQFDLYSSLLSTDIASIYIAAEQYITNLPGYTDLCFTNDLRNGVVNSGALPTCAPVSSFSQYIFPVWSGTEWYLNGTGSTFQLDYISRLFTNGNYPWFVDNNFSSKNTVALQLRSQFTFASTKSEGTASYHKRIKEFLPMALDYINKGYAVQLPFVNFYLGGGSSEDIKIEIIAEKETYKVGVAAVICFVLSWWHCNSFVMGLYTAWQCVMVYFAACGLYELIYKSLPMQTYSAIIWVMTFCMHGTLSFYDMFIFSGIMATKGRQNNLSVVQRLCFTIRRISAGVWLADILAIIIFAINTTSVFNSVIQFSIFMMIALLWNMYCIVLTTPSMVIIHHLTFSNKRRNLQKQTDALNAAMVNCRRDPHLITVLEAVQQNLSSDETAYALDEDLAMARIGVNQGINKKQYAGVGDFFREQMREGLDRVQTARKDVVGALHKVNKTKRQVLEQPDRNAAEMPAFTLQDFLQVGDANPLTDESSDVRGDARPLYYNPRMVLTSDLIHIPAAYVERSEACWSALRNAVGRVNNGSESPEEAVGLGTALPPRAFSLKNQGDDIADVEAFSRRWVSVGTRLGVETTSSSYSSGLVPFAVRSIVRSQDPRFIVDPTLKSEKKMLRGIDAATAVAPTTTTAVPTGGATGMGLRKLRDRWKHRRDVQRSRCWGMFGSVKSETPEQRMRRMMGRKVKRDGYSFFERGLINHYLPAIHCARWVLFALLIVLFIALCIAGSFIKSAGIPYTLIAGEEDAAQIFSELGNSFGQRGSCTFCGPYYQSQSVFTRSTASDIAVCSPKYGDQMYLFVDSCGVCNGTDACVDCANVVSGSHILNDCGGCTLSADSKCTCSITQQCPYCEWALDTSDVNGAACATTCTSTTCGSNGYCSQYESGCTCNEGFTGSTCDTCSAWLVPIGSNPDCTKECDITHDSTSCNCDLYTGKCNSCPSDKRGYNCDYNVLDCQNGSFDATTLSCVCDTGYSGVLCNESDVCNGRGVWLTADESPTATAMCACNGHWRGDACQICDCLNGGMCTGEAGTCECVGAFTGPRCESCAASCVSHGTCPTVTTPDYSYWDVRTCIANACSTSEASSGTLCSACIPESLTQGSCTYTDEASCTADENCWWYVLTSGSSCALGRGTAVGTVLDCTCTYSSVWGGSQCETCLGPDGSTCLTDGNVIGCNGLTYSSVILAMGNDKCGVCGGNGFCRGCDGVPGSGLTYDRCGVCGGNGVCNGTSYATPMEVDYLFTIEDDSVMVNNLKWCQAMVLVCHGARIADSASTQANSIIEDYVGSGDCIIPSVYDLYNYAKSNGRMDEAIFSLDYNGYPQKLIYINYRVKSAQLTNESSANSVNNFYQWYQDDFIPSFSSSLSNVSVSLMITSTLFENAVAKVASRQSLWFTVGIGLSIAFVFLFVFFVSITIAATATMVASILCFGSLTVCLMLGWEVDAILQVCISCTIPIGVEYIVHFCSGYFDYLQTTTSHLFARDLSRRTAVQGALLRSAPSVCTCVVSVIFISIMFDVSTLLPSRRSGQISITMHLFIIIAGVLFTGAVAAIGPMKAYQHWTISTGICFICIVLAAIAILIIYGANGVVGPTGSRILRH